MGSYLDEFSCFAEVHHLKQVAPNVVRYFLGLAELEEGADVVLWEVGGWLSYSFSVCYVLGR